MTRAQRIHLLRLACASDRLELAMLSRKAGRSAAVGLLQHFGAQQWFEIGSSVLGPLLPRKLRLLLTIARMWRQARSAD
jgi:hypothetical protein